MYRKFQRQVHCNQETDGFQSIKMSSELKITQWKTNPLNAPLTRGRSQSVFVERRDAETGGIRRDRSCSAFVIQEDDDIAVDISVLINDLEDNTTEHRCIDRSRGLTEKESVGPALHPTMMTEHLNITKQNCTVTRGVLVGF